MRPLRLIIIATVMVAVLSLVAGFSAENDRRGERTTTSEGAVARPAATPNRVVEAKVPSKEPIEVREGETIRLTMTLATEDTVTIDEIGFDETVAAGIPTEILFTPYTPGEFPFRLQNSGKDIGTLVVKPARPVPERQEPAPAKPAEPTDDPAPAGSASA